MKFGIVSRLSDSLFQYQGWPTVCRDDDGVLYVGASSFRLGHLCGFGKNVLYVSRDGGESWSCPRVFNDNALDDRDVGLCVFGESGLIATSFNNTIEFQRENMPQTQECLDYINSVSPEDEERDLGINYRISHDCGESFGPIMKSPISSPHGPTVLNDGTVLWVGRQLGVHNHIYAYTLDTATGEMTLRGDMGIYNYDEFKDLHCYEPHAIQLPDGKIICHLRVENAEETKFTLYQTESLDNGVTWSKPHQIIPDDSGAPAHIFRHSSGTLISTISHRKRPYGIWVVFSTDNGETWSKESILHNAYETDDLGYPSTIELDSGELITAFYTRRSDEDCDPAYIAQQKWIIEE